MFRKKYESGFIKGCLIFLLVLVCIILLLGFGAYMMFRKAQSFTSEKPLSIPIETTQEQYWETQNHFSSIQQAINGQSSSNNDGTYIITQDDINTFIAKDPGLEAIRGKARVTINDHILMIEASVPLAMIPGFDSIPGFKDRYFNGTIAGTFSLENRKIQLGLENLYVGGKSLPESVLKEFQKSMSQVSQDFEKKVQEDPKLQQLCSKIQSIKIHGGKIYIHIPPAQNASPETHFSSP